MLKLRILTASVLIPVFVLAVLYLEDSWFALLMALVIAAAVWEWTTIAGMVKLPQRLVYALGVVSLLGLAYLLRSSPLIQWMILASTLCWVMALWIVLRYQMLDRPNFDLPVPVALIGILVLVPPWISLILLRAGEPDGVKSVLFLLVLIWSADITAYFCGRRWGRKKLCERVSPGKSREGVYGALMSAVGLALIAAWYLQMHWLDLLLFIFICLLTVLASVLGDLLESLMKRLAQVKDSGTILPGHGGVLDRIDSLTAALPVFFSALWLWKKLA